MIQCCEKIWSSLTLVFVLFVPVIAKLRNILWITLVTLPRDLKLLYRGVRLFVAMKLSEWMNQNAGQVIENSAERAPNKICFREGDEQLTFKEVNNLSNQMANYFALQGLKKGDVVALFMDSRVEYPCVWLGLSKIGVITALINYNLKLESLRHCVQVANAKVLIYGQDYEAAVKEVLDEGGFKDIDLYCFDALDESKNLISQAKDLKAELKNVSTSKPTSQSPINHSDKLCYVYTSGTTGLPKAAVIKHCRFLMMARVAHTINGCRDDDVFMTPLPLYHMAGGMMAIGQAVLYTTTVVVTRKFSASRFWNDCIRYDVTVTQYLGEICRFLLSQPKKPEDTAHKLRLVMGNGLRADIWKEFITRFNIPELVEFYGSTEGNCGLSNFCGQVGAVGYLPRFLIPFLPMTLVRVDEYTGEPIRNPKTGLGILCQPNEPGELIAAISHNHPMRDFTGYTDASSNNKKILRNIFKVGDSCFRAGDLLMMDDYGYFYFRDRTGDTFRWKGENVSTMEVEAVINRLCEMKDVAVYGVQIPGMDGRAGMAAIADPDGTIDLDSLAAGLVKNLPAYARPVFVRVLRHNVDITGTFKLKKFDLQKEEINIDVIKDKIYVFQRDKYVEMTPQVHSQIISGQLRL